MFDKFFLGGVCVALLFVFCDIFFRLGNTPEDVRQDQRELVDHNKIKRLLRGDFFYDDKLAILVFYRAGEKPEPEEQVRPQEQNSDAEKDRLVKLVSIARMGNIFYAYGLVSTGDKLDTKRLKKGDVIGNEVVTGMSVDSITLSSTLSSDQKPRVLFIFSTKDQVSSKG